MRRNHKGYRVGEQHQRAKLPDTVIESMRAEYLPYVRGYGYLAKKYGCGESTARDIVNYWTRP